MITSSKLKCLYQDAIWGQKRKLINITIIIINIIIITITIIIH